MADFTREVVKYEDGVVEVRAGRGEGVLMSVIDDSASWRFVVRGIEMTPDEAIILGSALIQAAGEANKPKTEVWTAIQPD